jgi:hypothetical protein
MISRSTVECSGDGDGAGNSDGDGDGNNGKILKH